MYAIDFGTGDALAIHGPGGPVSKKTLKLPRVKGGKTVAQEFIMIAESLMCGCDGVPAGDIVIENATIGASGCEVDDMVDLLERVPGRKVFKISCRAVLNYRRDHKLGWDKGARYAKDGTPPPVVMTLEEQKKVHVKDAEIIYEIAKNPARLIQWVGPTKKIPRIHTSVRPMDKRLYRDARADEFMALLPPYDSLPDELRDVTGNGNGYARAFVMPLAMASTEPYLDDGPVDDRKKRYEELIGFSDQGHPSFYRRQCITWMKKNAKRMADVSRMEEVPRDIRKKALQTTSRQIRELFHLTMAHQGR